MRKILLVVVLVMVLSGCESWQRTKKDISSDFSGGISRTLTVYDYTGKEIKKYEGKFDIQETEGNKIKFDMNGKRTIIYNAVVICEEK